MSALHIRKVDDAVVRALKERAAANNRSLEAELREVLREAAFGPTSARSDRRPLGLRLKTVAVGADTDYGRDEIYRDDAP